MVTTNLDPPSLRVWSPRWFTLRTKAGVLEIFCGKLPSDIGSPAIREGAVCIESWHSRFFCWKGGKTTGRLPGDAAECFRIQCAYFFICGSETRSVRAQLMRIKRKEARQQFLGVRQISPIRRTKNEPWRRLRAAILVGLATERGSRVGVSHSIEPTIEVSFARRSAPGERRHQAVYLFSMPGGAGGGGAGIERGLKPGGAFDFDEMSKANSFSPLVATSAFRPLKEGAQ